MDLAHCYFFTLLELQLETGLEVYRPIIEQPIGANRIRAMHSAAGVKLPVIISRIANLNIGMSQGYPAPKRVVRQFANPLHTLADIIHYVGTAEYRDDAANTARRLVNYSMIEIATQ